MMRHELPLGAVRLGCADLEFPIDRDGIAIDNFAVESLGEMYRQRRFATCCGSNDDD
jgi:hypothetical protein